MKKYIGFLVVIMILAGCSDLTKSSLKEPPVLEVTANSGTKEAVLGTYCWTSGSKSECVDKVGPIDLVENEEEVVVQKGEKIQFEQKEAHRPNKYFLTEIKDGQEKEIQIAEYAFIAPTKPGVYTYGFTGTWDGKGEDKLSGDAQYAFKLKVE